MNKALTRKTITTGAAWLVALLIFFPIIWMVLTSFKTELEAVSTPPSLFFSPTMENYRDVAFGRADYLQVRLEQRSSSRSAPPCWRSSSRVPAAYAMAFFPTRRTKDVLLWMLSTKFMPAVGVLVPIYLIFRDTGLLDVAHRPPLVYTLSNLPIVIWMLFSFFKEVPHEILEAGRMDGAHAREELVHLLLPLAAARHRLHRAAVHHPELERGLLEPQPDGLQGGAAHRTTSPRSRARRGSSGRSSRPPPRWPSPPSSSSAG